MIEHIGLHAKDAKASQAFYVAALKPLGYKVNAEFPEWNVVGMGESDKSDFWISGGGTGTSTHIAFGAKSHAEVDAFYEAAIAAGGKDNGKPGLRTDYSPTYYAAFVLDLDGNNIEVVCHT